MPFNFVTRNALTQLPLPTDWGSVADHEAFRQTPDFLPMVTPLRSLNVGELRMIHADWTDASAQKPVFAAPVTEFAVLYAESKDAGLDKAVGAFADVVKGAAGCAGAATGWIVEELPLGEFGVDKVGRAAVIAVGWESAEARETFRDSETFEQAKKGLEENSKGIKGSVLTVQEV